MSRKQYSLGKQLAVAAALALGAGGALADDSSMNPFTGDSYRYFNGYNLGGPAGQRRQQTFSKAAADPSWRQSHPSGLTGRELQAFGSSSVAAIASQVNPPVFASAPADPSWRQSHPNGLTERELQAAGSSSVARWQIPDAMGATTDQSNVAQNPSKETSLARK